MKYAVPQAERYLLRKYSAGRGESKCWSLKRRKRKMRKTRWRGWSRLLLVFEEKNADGDGGG
jgi:hypothetical protein